MASIMTKRGSQDNVVTYEHICDTRADMASIEDKYITLGSTCIILKGTSGGMEVYIADSDHQWQSLAIAGGSSSSSSSEVIIQSNPLFYVCTSSQVRINGTPKITSPEENTIYLVPTDGETNNLFNEYLYVNGKWEMVGSAGIDLSEYVTYEDLSDYVIYEDLSDYVTQDNLSGYAPIDSPNFENSISMGREAESTIGTYSVAIGNNVVASGSSAHAEGNSTTASGPQSHAEGQLTTASNTRAHAEGYQTAASSDSSHAEGYSTSAEGMGAHAEGGHTFTKGNFAHAEGYYTEANTLSHVSGIYNIRDNLTTSFPDWVPYTEYKFLDRVRATYNNINKAYICTTEHTSSNSFNNDINKWTESIHSTSTDYNVIAGIYNFAEIVGNGQSENNRSNARALDWRGNEYLSGDLYIHCNKKSTEGLKVVSNMPLYKTIATYSVNKEGQYIWRVGEKIYYNAASYSQVLDKDTHTWKNKQWYNSNGSTLSFNSIKGNQIWTDGVSTYCTSKTYGTYELVDSTSWRNISTSNTFDGIDIWTDGENNYYDSANSHYKININNSTFTVSPMTWNGLTNFDGRYIWTDGEHIYYSNNAEQYVLDKSNATWEPQEWNGLTQFSREYIWTDKENVYYSNGKTHYLLDKTTNTWNPINWNNLSFYGKNIWTDGINIYCTQDYNEYQLFSRSPKILASNFDNEFIPIDVQTFMKENSQFPVPPTTDGTYTLQVTVTDGTPTYSWV